MKKTLGVLITYFNEKNLLSECLESLLSQIDKPDEIIIYDDASESPAERYIPPDSQIRIIRGKNRKFPAAARNILMRTSQSDYIHFHDCDDFFCSNWCQRIRKTIEETDADCIINGVSCYKNGNLVSRDVIGLEELEGEKDTVKFSISHAILTSSTTIRRTSALNINGYRECLSQSEDYDFHIRLAASGVSCSIIKEPLIFKQLRNSSHSSLHNKEVWKSSIETIKLLTNRLDKKYNIELAEAAARAGSKLFELGAIAEARQSFSFAYKLARPHFKDRSKLYRFMARVFGPFITESLGIFYRRLYNKKQKALS